LRTRFVRLALHFLSLYHIYEKRNDDDDDDDDDDDASFLTKSSHITYVERTHLDICTMDWLCSRQAFQFSCLQNQRIISYIHRSTVTLLRAKIHIAVNLQQVNKTASDIGKRIKKHALAYHTNAYT